MPSLTVWIQRRKWMMIELVIPAILVILWALLSATLMHYMIRGLLRVTGD